MTEEIPIRKTSHEVITVILGNSSPTTSKDFHCTCCGRIVFNYYTEVKIILNGEMREVSRPIDVMCSRCHIVYRIE